MLDFPRLDADILFVFVSLEHSFSIFVEWMKNEWIDKYLTMIKGTLLEWRSKAWDIS